MTARPATAPGLRAREMNLYRRYFDLVADGSKTIGADHLGSLTIRAKPVPAGANTVWHPQSTSVPRTA